MDETMDVVRKPGKLWLRYSETVCIKILHWEVAETVQKLIQNWEEVILIIMEIL